MQQLTLNTELNQITLAELYPDALDWSESDSQTWCLDNQLEFLESEYGADRLLICFRWHDSEYLLSVEGSCEAAWIAPLNHQVNVQMLYDHLRAGTTH